MIEHALAAGAAGGALRHAALVTGLKHYLGSFDNYAEQELDTPFTEDQPRVPGDNFYYTQEDILFAAAKKHGFTWSVARPHTIIGYAPGNAMNLGTSLAVYATLCKETGRPFRFPGSPQQYAGLVDMTDARLLAAASHLGSDHARRRRQGLQRRQRRRLPLAKDVGQDRRLLRHRGRTLSRTAQPARHDLGRCRAGLGEASSRRHGSGPIALEAIAPWWHVDADLGRTQECMADMGRSRELGFLDYQPTWPSFVDLFDRLRRERIIP